MSATYRAVLHNTTSKSHFCSAHDMGEIERALLRQRLTGTLGRHIDSVNRLSDRDGYLTGGYCHRANAEIGCRKLTFNTDLRWLSPVSTSRQMSSVAAEPCGGNIEPATPIRVSGGSATLGGFVGNKTELGLLRPNAASPDAGAVREHVNRRSGYAAPPSNAGSPQAACGPWVDSWVDSWIDRQRNLSQPRLLWSPPISGIGDQLKSLVTVFWLSLLERRRLELVPGVQLSEVISFGGADVQASQPAEYIAATLANPNFALVTVIEGTSKTNLMKMWAQLHENPASSAVYHIDQQNIGDKTDNIFKFGWFAAAGINKSMRPTDLTACVLHRLVTFNESLALHRMPLQHRAAAMSHSAATVPALFAARNADRSETSAPASAMPVTPLREWLLRHAMLNEKIVDNTVHMLEEEEVLSVADLRILTAKQLSSLTAKMKPATGVKITNVLQARATASDAPEGPVPPPALTESALMPPALLVAQRPLICMQIRTGKLIETQDHLRERFKEFMTFRAQDGTKTAKILDTTRAELHASKGIPRVQDAEMLSAHSTINFTAEDVPAFIQCAQQIEHTLGETAEWFVTTDSTSLQQHMKGAFGEKVTTAPWGPRHIQDASVHSSTYVQMLAEWRLLADECDHLIVTKKSSFGLTAAAVAQTLRRASVHLIEHAMYIEPNLPCTAHAQYIDLAQMEMLRHHDL